MAALWGRSDGQLDDARAAAVAAAGVGVARIPAQKSAEEVGALLDALRRRYRIDQGGLHALVGGEGVAALTAIAANRHQFQTVTTFGDAAGVDLGLAGRMRGRRVRAIGDVDARALAAHVARLHAARAERGEAADVARALDSFHDAAAVADGGRYFALFPPDAVFLGTDASERWSGAEFRAFAARYFERPSAWVYVPFERHVTVTERGDLAWFDEALDNAGYGECRGSGVLVRRGGAWVLQQYNLTVPVPNDLMAGVARQIRAHEDGGK